MLGVVYIAVSVTILGVVAAVDGGVLFRLVVLAQALDEKTLTGDPVMLAGQLALLLFAPLMMAYWYAPVLVAWHQLSVAKALFFSFVACRRNWRAFLVYSLAIVLIGALGPGLVVGLLSALFSGGVELVSVVLTSLIGAGTLADALRQLLRRYRDVFVSIDENV